MEKQILISKIYVYLLGILIFFGLSLTSIYNYLLFHSLAEVFSIVVAFGIFVIAWNTRRFLDNNYLLFIGIAYLFVGALDLIHTLAYTGMGVFQGYETNLPTQLWISGRYMESISLLIAPLLFRRELKVNLIFLGYALATSILLFSIFYWNIFPVCFIEGMGLTPFKKISEYIISLILLASIVLLLKNRRELHRSVLQWLVWSIIATIASELAFTFYVRAYGFYNMIGHFLKIISFYFIYRALIETGLSKPYNLLFKNLKESEERFRNIFAESPIGIELYDSIGQLVEINKASLEIFGVSDAAEVKGFKLFGDPNVSDQIKERLKNVETVRYEAPFDFEKVRDHKLYDTTKSGTIYLDVLITPLGLEQKGTQSGYLVQVQDITERKRMEEELRKSRDELEIRVQERTTELAKANEELRAEITERKQTEESLRKLTYDLNERVKEINCLYSISYYVDKQYLLLEEKLKNIVNIIPSGWQYPEIACARIVIEDKEYKTDNFKETPWNQASEITVHDERIGTIEVYYLDEKPESDEGPFLKEERDLINAIAVELGEMIGHMKSDIALAEQSRILEAFFTSTITPLVFLDRDFNFIRVNEAYAKACQRKISEFPGHNHFELYPSDAKEIFEQVVQKKEPYQAIARPFAFPDHPEWGETYWDWTLTPVLDDVGEVEFLVFSLEDVTERKRAEEAVEAERLRFNDVLEMLPAYVVLLTPDYHIPFANRIFRERFGESRGRRCFEYLFGRTEPCETCETYTILKTNAPHHWEWTGPDGRIYDIYDFPFTDTDGSPLIMEMGIDITERKRAEEALRAASLYSRSLIEASLDPLVTISADGKIMDVNKATELVTGVSRDRLIGSDFSNYFTDPEKAREGYKKVFQTGLVWDYPLAIRDPSGRVTEVLYNATVYKNEAGEVQGMFAAARDITELKRTQDALKAASLYTRSLIEASLDPLVTISADGKIMDVNRTTEFVTGVSRDHLIGSDFSYYFTEPEKAREGYQEVFLKGSVRDYPLAIRHTTGKVTDVLYHATVFKNEVGEIQGVFAAARDITVRKELQRRIEATNALLNLFVRMPSRKDYADAVLKLIQDWCGCRCAGIRVLDRQGNIPYESYTGFSREFWESENFLSLRNDQCVCIRVITGEMDPQDAPVVTPAGSFCCGNTVKFVQQLSEEGKRRYRGVCVESGFLSVAVIPIHYGEKILGAIHLADEKEGIVPLSSIEFIESMAPLIGEAIRRFNLEEELKDSENRLRHLSSQLLTVQENERKRISREIHDGLGQSLSAIKFKTESITQQMRESRFKKMAESLGTILPIIQESIEESRRIQMDLRPSILDDLGIIATLTWFSREFQQTYSDIHIDKEIEIVENEVPDTLKTVIYRIFQEALNNIAKHSQADLIHFSLKKAVDQIEMTIQDNGKGFDLEKTLSVEASRKGLGLTSMRERTELSGGIFEMQSTLEKGTIIRAVWLIS